MGLILSIHLYTLENVHTTSEINPEGMMEVNTSKKYVNQPQGKIMEIRFST